MDFLKHYKMLVRIKTNKMTKRTRTKLGHSLIIIIIVSFFLGCSEKNDEVNIPEEDNTSPPLEIVMSISETSLNYGYFDETRSFIITNTGDAPFNWNWSDSTQNSWVTANPNTGTLAVGGSVEVLLTVDRTNLATQTYNLGTTITNSGGQSANLSIQVVNYSEEKWLIDGDIIDAEYDKNNDVMIVVSQNPNEIRKFDPANSIIASLALDNLPKCVSISQDGNYAVVGYNSSFSYINLETMTLEKIYPLTTDTFDIILAPNNWVYVLADDNYEKMRCIDLTNGKELLHQYGSTFASPSKAKLHPSGNYIYATKKSTIPTDFYKFDITGGQAVYLYNSKYHGDYDFGENIWISDNGDKLYANSRNVFNSSSTQNNDMIYINTLEGNDDQEIETMDINSNAGRIYTIFNSDPNGFKLMPSNKVRMYTTQFSYLGEVELPGFMLTNENGEINFYDSHGYYGFFNSDASNFFVLVKSHIQNKWAIATLNVK